MAECLHCGGTFKPRKHGHVFCSIACRHRGERPAHERVPADPDAVARLFDASRDPKERVRPDDWHPNPGTRWVEIDLVSTVEKRRRWYENLLLGR